MIHWVDMNTREEFNLSDYPDSFGMIYEIVYTNGFKYRGKRNFFKTVTLPRNSNRKKKEVFLREDSSWQSYSGSSKLSKGMKVKSKSILAIADTKRALTYLEAKYLFQVDAIFNAEYLNENINGVWYSNVFDPLKVPQRKEFR